MSVFPAHAGMSLNALSPRATGLRFPRPRGDEPHGSSLADAVNRFSPPTRG